MSSRKSQSKNEYRIPITNNADLGRGEFRKLVDSIPQTNGLAEILAWAGNRDDIELPPKIVPLDEFTNDIIFEFQRLWLVFGVT